MEPATMTTPAPEAQPGNAVMLPPGAFLAGTRQVQMEKAVIGLNIFIVAILGLLSLFMSDLKDTLKELKAQSAASAAKVDAALRDVAVLQVQSAYVAKLEERIRSLEAQLPPIVAATSANTQRCATNDREIEKLQRAFEARSGK